MFPKYQPFSYHSVEFFGFVFFVFFFLAISLILYPYLLGIFLQLTFQTLLLLLKEKWKPLNKLY